MKRIVVFTGAGISAESGIKTFRDNDGLWENHNVLDVATPEAWNNNPELVLKFYNERRKQISEALPNVAHKALKKLELKFHVQIITQNIDDLHERAGSSHILHLHGEINKARSTTDNNLVYPIIGNSLKWGEKCEKGSQLRPHVVWFGEEVPNMNKATQLTSNANLFLIVGTSLNVYPAASLVQYVDPKTEIILIDPRANSKNLSIKNLTGNAGEHLPILVDQLLNK